MVTSPRPLGPRALAERRPSSPPDGRLLLLVPDPHARFAAVELDAGFVADEVREHGYGLCTYVFCWSPERTALSEVDESLRRYADRYGDLRLRPDFASLTALPDGTSAVVCDAEWPSGEPVAAAPRQALAAQLRTLEELGFVPSVGIEHEVVFTGADGAPMTGHGVDYALGGTEKLAPLLRELRSDVDGAGLGLESARAECHPGQYELVLRHRDALAACDDAMLLQHLVRTAAARHGVEARYLAAPEPGQGSSCHVHLSLSTADGQAGMTGALGHFLGGVLRDAAVLTPIWAPTWNSYVRLRTAPFSPIELRWGTDDRTAAVRLAGRGDSARLEFRFAGADAQPHLVVAALLASGRAGIEDGLAVPGEGTPAGALASTPWEALRAFTESTRPAELLGTELASQQAALLSEELDSGLGAVTDWQRRRARLRA
ncbi:glutamine synthetase [Amycolatopsis sp. CA-230715]|uniref:glutamine synthetase n=1 Tax=Amycolatopsis sp. CA-230715 TaxID=2745196 RepID=UPI0020B3D51A|nr:glutamine synthetase [Amycolatopsis sp. CA-230715]